MFPLPPKPFFFVLRSVVLYTVPWICWKFLSRATTKTDLDNIPERQSWLTGNSMQIFDIDGWNYHKELAQKFGSIIKHGLYGSKQLYVYDPKALHHIIVKDQRIYEENPAFTESARVFFGEGLLATMEWAKFTKVDIYQWTARTALELIVQSGLGCSVDPLTETAELHPYSVAVKDLTPAAFSALWARMFLLPTLVKVGSPKFRRFIIDYFSWGDIRRMRDIIDVMHNTAVEIFEGKKRALKEGDAFVEKQIGKGKDIMSILMRANMEAAEGDRLSEAEVLGQMSTSIFAGMDTTSGALTRTFHLLALHPNVQENLRQELLEARKNLKGAEFNYDELNSLPYLDAIIRETLRLYPPAASIARTTVHDAILPFSNPVVGVDGRPLQEIAVPNGTDIIISVLSYNRNRDLWGDDAYEWKPERWLSPLPDSAIEAHGPGIYSNMMTFLGGGRACIGFKFSQLEMKVVVSVLLSKFRLSPSDKKVVWEMSTPASLAIEGLLRQPQLPMMVERI